MRNILILSAASLALLAAPAAAADVIYQSGGATQATDPANATPAIQGDRFRVFLFNRDKTGDTELHLEGIDNLVVLDGEATLVYGGDMAGGHMIGEGEFRGSGLSGDTKSVELHKDDLVQIPAGMPQWIKPHGHIRYVVFRVPGRKD